ncbi:MAG: alpha/beta hydrolase-fold protein [Burkholderiaceae bacterium]
MNPPTDIDRRTVLGLPLALSGLAATATAATAAAPATPAPAAGQQAPWATPATVTLHATLRHWLYLPPGYADEPTRGWPLIVFLHGSGERGSEIAKVKVHGLPKLIDAGLKPPAIVVSPQCEDDQDWDPHLLHGLLQSLRARWRVDPARVTATGLSMGGGGCWDWAMTYPDDLAGIAPVCGYGREMRIPRMRAVAVRAYHGEADTVVLPAEQKELVSALRMAGGRAELTLYPGVGHDAWNPAYADPGMLPWLLEQRRA